VKVTLIDYTGYGTLDPAHHAAAVLIFTKSTRLEMKPGLMDEIQDWSYEKMLEELRYMSNTIPSSWEYIHYTFLIEGVTRAFTHQFVRTRTGSYAQQTMRVLNVEGWEYLTGPSIKSVPGRKETYDSTMGVIATDYDELIKDGAAIEDARGILPTNILTNIVASFNMRTMAEMFRKRESLRTQGEYRDVLAAMKAAMLSVHPFLNLFFDRTFDVAARELQQKIADAKLPTEQYLRMIKLLDQMRAGE
jgi:thymidylate synthase (FAD)